MKKKVLLFILCLACVGSFAQTKKRKHVVKRAAPQTNRAATPPPAVAQQPVADTSRKVVSATPKKHFDPPLDGYYKKSNILSAKVTPYANVREADVAFQKRVWREFDLRDKMNNYLGSPKARLIDVIMQAVDAGELTAYDPTQTKDDPGGDTFLTPLTAAEAHGRMADSSRVDKFDKNTGEKIGSVMQGGEFNPDSIVRFRIKEDWIFDRQRSIFEPRIIGIAPLIKHKLAGVELDYQPAFWIYFPDARKVFAVKEVASANSDATGLSFDDVFMKRIFDSYLVKVSNAKDESIKDYAQGIDKLYEAERLKKQLMDWELTLWQY